MRNHEYIQLQWILSWVKSWQLLQYATWRIRRFIIKMSHFRTTYDKEQIQKLSWIFFQSWLNESIFPKFAILTSLFLQFHANCAETKVTKKKMNKLSDTEKFAMKNIHFSNDEWVKTFCYEVLFYYGYSSFSMWPSHHDRLLCPTLNTRSILNFLLLLFCLHVILNQKRWKIGWYKAHGCILFGKASLQLQWK